MIRSSDETIPDPPDIPGLTFRPLRAGDAEALVAVQEARKDHDRIDPLSTFESVPTLGQAAWWVDNKEKMQSLDTVLVAEVNGVVAGYAWLEWWTETTGVRLFLSQAALRPEWRGRGIGTAMLGWAEARLRAVASRQTETGPAFFGANATETEEEDTALLHDAGYRREFSVIEMERLAFDDLPEMPLPEGLALRPLEPEHFLSVGRSVTEAYAASMFSVVPSDDEDHRQVEWLRGFDPSLCFVAWDGEQVAGQVLCRIDKGRGEMAEVSVRQPWRRRGLAKALLARALQAFRERGVKRVRLHTVAENQYGSVRLYQSVGFRVIKDHIRYRKPMEG